LILGNTLTSGTNYHYMNSYYKVATTSETSSYAWTINQRIGEVASNDVMGWLNVVSNAASTSAVPQSAGATSGTTATKTFTAPSITTTSTNNMAIVDVGQFYQNSTSTWTPPTGNTEITDNTCGDSWGSYERSYFIKTTAGATGTKSPVPTDFGWGLIQQYSIKPFVGPAGVSQCIGATAPTAYSLVATDCNDRDATKTTTCP
jgi:hypothetical protein